MWRYDSGRTAASPLELPGQLYLQWKVEAAPPRPAFPHDNRLRFDLSYEPVVLGKTMFLPSMVTDSVTALETETGQERWTFFADGPVRFAPVAWGSRVCFVSDDGYLYCLDAGTGALRWKFTPVPLAVRGQKLLGHERLISRWPARGGPVLKDGVVYFAAGVFPFEGVWVCAVRAETGEVAWVNRDCALIPEANQDHGGQWDAGLSPQGYLAIVGGRLAVPSGRALPGFFDRHSGAMEPYSAGWGGRTGLAKGSWYVASIGKYLLQSGDLYGPLPQASGNGAKADALLSLSDLARETNATLGTVERWVKELGLDTLEQDGGRFVRIRHWGGSHLYWVGSAPKRPREQHVQSAWPRLQIDPANDRRELGEFREPVLTPDAMYYSQSRDLWLKKKEQPFEEIVACDITKPGEWQVMHIQGTDAPPRDLVPWKTVAFDRLWSLPCKLRVHIKAGPRLYCGANGVVAAVDIPAPGGKPAISWQAHVEGNPSRILAADDKLFVVTQEGAVYAFGATQRPAQVHAASKPAQRATGDAWTTRAAQVLKQSATMQGYCLALGIGTGRLVEELVRQSELHIVVLEPAAEKAEQARRKFHALGLCGTRLHVIPAGLLSLDLPPHLASLVVAEDLEDSGLDRGPRFAERLFASLRPYGGTACLAPGARSALVRWLQEARPAGAQLKEVDGLTTLTRLGELPDAADWTHEAGSEGNTFASTDGRVKPPFGVLWFGGALDRLGPGCRDVPRVCGGRMFVHFRGDLLALDIYTGRDLWKAAGISSPGFVAVEDGVYVLSGGACLRLDPATGSKLDQIDVPAATREGKSWGAFRIWDQYFVGTTGKEFRFPGPFEFDFVGAAGRELLCLDRQSRKTLWRFGPQRDGVSFAMGRGKVFCIDYWLPVHRRRGEPKTEEATIAALDVANGQVQWQTILCTPAADKSNSPFGLYQPMPPWLAYCETSDLLVLTANWSTLGAFRGSTGAKLWTKDIPCADPPSRYSAPQPPILLPDVLITHGGQRYDPSTGTLFSSRLWQGINAGTRGCNRALAGAHVVLLRDADISYFDLATARQTRLRGIRSGCTNALLPAGGILNAPNFAYHCSCNWPISTSMALVHMPEAVAWDPARGG
jgi:outer membrane protein assembly factor BamB